MTQRKYCLELLHEYGLLAAKPIDTPLPENSVLSCAESDNGKFLNNITNYQKVVGKLIYLQKLQVFILESLMIKAKRWCTLELKMERKATVCMIHKTRSCGLVVMLCLMKKKVGIGVKIWKKKDQWPTLLL